MKKILFSLLIIILSFQVKAQVYVNPGVDTTDNDIKRVIKFYTDYVSEFKGKELPDFTKYWSAEDSKKYKIPDPAIYGINGAISTYSMADNKTINYVKPLDNGITLLKSVGGWIDSLKNITVLYITNHYITTNSQNKNQFISPITFYKEKWVSKKIRNVNFIYQKNHSFNQKKADSLIKSIEKLEKVWNLKPINIDYYFADTYDEIQIIRGFDYSIGLGNRDKPSGISNDIDNVIYSAGNGENYFHEFVHVYLNKLYPKSPLNEGLSVFYGGTLGNKLNWHIPRLKIYLNIHKEINLNNLNDFYYMDNFTNPDYTIQGMLCNIAFKKHGIIGLKRIMSYESMNEVFEKEFKFDIKNLNTQLRELINSQ